MKKIDSRIIIGTKVKLIGISELCTVKERTSILIKVNEYMGSFQGKHIESFTNKK